jgi:hypothetical protein
VGNLGKCDDASFCHADPANSRKAVQQARFGTNGGASVLEAFSRRDSRTEKSVRTIIGLRRVMRSEWKLADRRFFRWPVTNGVRRPAINCMSETEFVVIYQEQRSDGAMPKYYVQSGPVRLVLQARNAQHAAIRVFQWSCEKQNTIRASTPLEHVLEAERRGWQLHEEIRVSEQGFDREDAWTLDTVQVVIDWQARAVAPVDPGESPAV